MKRGKRLVKLLAGLLCICLLFTSCAPAEISDEKSTDLKYSQEVQNLEKLCKVWGYTKYHHPAFLFGEKDWDEELLNLIPVAPRLHSLHSAIPVLPVHTLLLHPVHRAIPVPD